MVYWLSRAPNTNKVRSSRLRGDNTFISSGSAQHVPQPQQKKQTEWFRCLSSSKTKQLGPSRNYLSSKPSYNDACAD